MRVVPTAQLTFPQRGNCCVLNQPQNYEALLLRSALLLQNWFAARLTALQPLSPFMSFSLAERILREIIL